MKTIPRSVTTARRLVASARIGLVPGGLLAFAVVGGLHCGSAVDEPAAVDSENVMQGSESLIASDPWVARYNMTAAQYQAEFNTWTAQGFRVSDVTGYDIRGVPYFAAIFDKTTGPAWQSFTGMTQAQYNTKFTELNAQGYRPVIVNGYNIGTGLFYTAIFHKDASVPWQSRSNQTGAQFQADLDTLPAQGYRLTHISGYAVGSEDRFATVWEKRTGAGWYVHTRMSAEAFRTNFANRVAEGLRPVKVVSYSINGVNRYAAIFNTAASVPWKATVSLTDPQYQQASNELSARGYRPMNVTAHVDHGVLHFGLVWNALAAPTGSGAFFFEDSQRGGAGKLCQVDGSCNGGLVCSALRTCVNPITTTSRWHAGAQVCDPNRFGDCNPCAPNVKAQFENRWGTPFAVESWKFNWETNYPPSNREPDNVFTDHVQGFTRTNSSVFPFAGTYSSDTSNNGGIYFINGSMKYMHSAAHRHPSGVSAFGKYVVVADVDHRTRLMNLDLAATNHTIDFPTAGTYRAGGGVGIAKLASDGYLLISSPKGGDEAAKSVRFFHLHGNIENPVVTPAGTWAYTQPSGWSGDYSRSENLSVITECGTGDVYTAAFGGKIAPVFTNGFVLLSKVVQRTNGAGLGLDPIKAYPIAQSQAWCALLSAGSAWVAPNGAIDIMCSERASIDDPIFNDDNIRYGYQKGTVP